MRLETWDGFAEGGKFERLRRRIRKFGDYYSAALCVAKVGQVHTKEIFRVTEVSLSIPAW